MAGARLEQLRQCPYPGQTRPWKREVRRAPVPCTPKWRRPSGCPSTLPTPKDGRTPAPCGPLLPTPSHLAAPGKPWVFLALCVPPDPTQQKQVGSCTLSSPRDGAGPDTAGFRPAELHSLELQKPAPKIFTSPQTTTSKPPDLEMNHSSAPTRCHYHCHLHCHRCARAPSTSSLPPQRGQDPPMQHQTPKHLLPLLSVVPTIVPTPAAGGDRHSCPAQSCGDTHQH